MKKEFLRFPAAVVLPLYALYACVLAPVYRLLSIDGVLSATLWLDAVEVLYYWAEIFGMAALIGFAALGVYRYTVRGCLPYYLFAAGALLAKHVLSVVALGIVTDWFDVLYDAVFYIVSFLIECAILACAVWFAHLHTRGAAESERELQKAAERLGVEPPATQLTFDRLFSRKNPLQRATLWGILVMLAVRLVTFIVDDISYWAAGAAFRAGDIPVMLLYWVLWIILPCFIGYLLAWRLLKRATAPKAGRADEQSEENTDNKNG